MHFLIVPIRITTTASCGLAKSVGLSDSPCLSFFLDLSIYWSHSK
jgi:hypothetical protein